VLTFSYPRGARGFRQTDKTHRAVLYGGRYVPVEKKDYETLGESISHQLQDTIMKLKTAEFQGGKSEKRFLELYESLRDGSATVDMSGWIIESNTAFQNMLGYGHDELRSLTYNDFTPPKWHAVEEKIINDQVLTRGFSDLYEKEYIHKDGTVFPVELYTYLRKDRAGNPAGLWTIVRDITGRKNSEKHIQEANQRLRAKEQEVRAVNQQLKASEQQLRAANQQLIASEKEVREVNDYLEKIFSTTADGILVSGPDYKIVKVNKAMLEMLGYEESEMLGQSPRKFGPQDKKRLERHDIVFNDFLKKGSLHNWETVCVKKDGTHVPIETNLTLMKDNDGNMSGVVANIRNITERKKAEAERARLSAAVEQTAEAVIILGPDGRIQYVNQSMEKMTGFCLEEVRGINPFKRRQGVYDEEVYQNIWEHVLSGRVWTGGAVQVKKDGSQYDVESVISPLRDASGAISGFVITSRDVTHELKLQTQLQQAQKMEAIGTLAGGIAHDFNNLLTGIQGNSSLILLDITPDHPHYKRLKNIEQLVKSGGELTRQLLGFARGGKYEIKTTDINRFIQQGLDMFGRTKKEIAIHTRYQEGLWTVDIDRGQIEQVLMNLYINAWQAMPDGGDLYVATENKTIDASYVKPYKINHGKYIKISLTDSGIGMDDETQQKIFEPFFTTKEKGLGTGLGLASVYGIIKNHGGFIDVHSEVNKGSTFTLYLPASQKDLITEHKQEDKMVTGSGTILIVDDEEMIRDICTTVLKGLGYRVVSAGTGREALDVYEQQKDIIDLVILDMILPGISGGDIYRMLKNINPAVKVLLSSGYSINGQASALLDRGCNGFIQKPFGLETLSKKVKEILDRDD